MKKIFHIAMLILLVSNIVQAQVVKAELQAAGLTCSMCSRATDKQLRTLNFIDSIGIDLSHTTFILYFKRDKTVDFTQIRKKVEDAGFSVAMLKVTYHFDNLKIENGTEFSYGSNKFSFMDITPSTLNGDVTFRILDQGFVGAKEYKKYANRLTPGNFFHITI